MEKLARIISAIFSPLLIPTYAMAIVLWMTILFIVSINSKLGVMGMTFAITCIIPGILIMLLYKLKIISDSGLNKQNERIIPYIVTAICYFSLAFYLHSIHSPRWLYMFAIGAGAATVISAIVNRWWKISAHGAAIGGMIAFLFCILYLQLNVMNMMWLLYSSIIVAGIVGTSRLILERHTLMQVIAGIANGIICVLTAILLGC